ncbi:MAG: hypothetical protein LJE68_05455 [Rhodobacter sp.]|nr:hypothetical protein [Rhodobacter sp.]
MTRLAWAVVLALIVPPLLAWLGISARLGAHPWWDVSTALVGAPVGVVAGLFCLRRAKGAGFTLSLVVLAGAVAVAWYGKTQFAASFAEDAFAGKMWYFGWIGIAAGTSMLVFGALRR